ncbi:hypothetical protein ACFY0F_23705 [Streptomyces sp. NPDC001544]|uniref:hypothetical protein n=1 Tax=Streptomyces sp. NPDC001544 TaxID=3364584 RepID=UPI0036C34587
MNQTDPTAAHFCGNCEGIDPDTCLFNPDRPRAAASAVAAPPTDPAAVEAAVEQAVYEYREQTCQWEETDGSTQAIARLATRAALRAIRQDGEAAVTPPPALTEVGRLRARVEVLRQDAERDRGLAKVGARCMRVGHQGLIEEGRIVLEGWRFALSTALDLGTGAPWEAIHERVKELAAEAQQQPATETPGRRETVEYFVQSQQPDGTWEQAGGVTTDPEFAAQRLAARRKMMPDLELRIAERTTTVNVRALPGCLACRHWICDGNGPCGALLDAWQRCTCAGPAPVVQQPAAADDA